MSKSLEIQELALIIAAKNYDPSTLNPSFLAYSGIVSNEWELAKQPVVTNKASLVVFKNGVKIAAQPDRFMFVESISNMNEQKPEAPEVARRYIETLRHIDYQALGINFKGYVAFNNSPSGPKEYLFEDLLKPGPWQDCGNASLQAGLNFVYTFEHNRLNLSINEAALPVSDSEQLPIIMFSGNFGYDLSDRPTDERIGSLQQIIENWRTDLETYKYVVSKFLLAETDRDTMLSFPTSMPESVSTALKPLPTSKKSVSPQ